RVGPLFHGAAAVVVGIPVGLVLDVGDESENIAVAVDGDLPARIVHDGPGAVVVVLDHAEGGHMFQRRAPQRLFDGPDLPAAAVDQQQVRQGGELVLGAVG